MKRRRERSDIFQIQGKTDGVQFCGYIFLDWVKNHQQIVSVTCVHSETVCSSLHCSSAAVEHG